MPRTRARRDITKSITQQQEDVEQQKNGKMNDSLDCLQHNFLGFFTSLESEPEELLRLLLK